MPRLLFDENLSPRLTARLAPAVPGSRHVRDLGLRACPDADLWARAPQEGWAIVTKDDDFRQLSFLYGAPPKVIWLAVGNAGTDTIADLLERQLGLIEAFDRDPVEAILILRLPSR